MRLKCVQRFSQNLLNTHVSTFPKEFLYCGNKFRIEVLGKSLAWVIREDPDKHNRVVLNIGTLKVVLGEEFANAIGSLPGCGWTRLGRFNNDRKVEDFFALESDQLIISDRDRFRAFTWPCSGFAPPDSQNNRWRALVLESGAQHPNCSGDLQRRVRHWLQESHR